MQFPCHNFHDFFVAIDGHGIDMNLPIFSDYLGADGFGKHNLAGSVVEAFLDRFILRGDVLRDKKKVLNLLCCDFYDQSCGGSVRPSFLKVSLDKTIPQVSLGQVGIENTKKKSQKLLRQSFMDRNEKKHPF